MAGPAFYKSITVKFNDEDESFEFVNSVQVAEQFIRLQAILAQLTERSTVLTSEVNNLEIHLDRKKRELNRLKTRLFALHYGRITKTASPDIQEAFLRMLADEENQVEALDTILDAIEEITQEIEIRTPRMAEFKSDQRLIEKIAEFSKQYLDHEKLKLKIENRIA